MNPDSEEFSNLCVKVLAGRASDFEREKHRALVEESEPLRLKHADIKRKRAMLGNILGLVDAMEATGPGMTKAQDEELMALVRSKGKAARDAQPPPGTAQAAPRPPSEARPPTGPKKRMGSKLWIAMGILAISMVALLIRCSTAKHVAPKVIPNVEVGWVDTAWIPVGGKAKKDAAYRDEIDVVKQEIPRDWTLTTIQFNESEEYQSWLKTWLDRNPMHFKIVIEHSGVTHRPSKVSLKGAMVNEDYAVDASFSETMATVRLRIFSLFYRK